MLNLIQLGLGPLGQKIVQFAQDRNDLRIVAAVDPAPDKANQPLDKICQLKKTARVTVRDNLTQALGKKPVQVAVITTVSSLEKLIPQIQAAAEAGLHIVSTCEELSHPWQTQPALAKKIDRICKKHNIACVGTGINPGFLMDFLPSAMTGICQDVKRIVVERFQDASSRRVPFQQKIGAALTPTEFKAKQKAGTLRHVGLLESIYMIADASGWKLDRTTESLTPIMAQKRITSGYTPIQPGQAAGVEQIGKGFIGSREVIRLHFRAAVGHENPHDTITITGSPNLQTTIPGGMNGDIGTCAITLNATHAVTRVSPGLKTMLDLPAVTWRVK